MRETGGQMFLCPYLRLLPQGRDKPGKPEAEKEAVRLLCWMSEMHDFVGSCYGADRYNSSTYVRAVNFLSRLQRCSRRLLLSKSMSPRRARKFGWSVWVSVDVIFIVRIYV